MSGNNYRPIDPRSPAARLSRVQANPIQVQHHTMPVQVQQPYYPQAPESPYPQAPHYYQQQAQVPQQPYYQQPQQYYQQPPPNYYQGNQAQYPQPAPPQNYQGTHYQNPYPQAPYYPQQLVAPNYQQTQPQEYQQPQQPIPEPPKTRRLITGDSSPTPMTQQIPLPTSTQRVNLGLSPAPAGAIPAPTPTQRLNVGQARSSLGGEAAPQLKPANLSGIGSSQMANPLGPGGESIPPPPPTRLLVGNADDLRPAEPTPAATQEPAAATPMDEAAIDSAVTSLGPVPYYSLSQVVANLQAANNTPTATSAVGVSAADAASGERYLDEHEIGEGGTSYVYRAIDKRMRRSVALKRFKSMSRSDKERDYTLEMKAASQVNHPYVVSIYDADVDEKGRYIAMELIEGFNMEDAVKLRELKFDINRFINFAEQALEGLEATHKAGLLHLDLKPSNIMLSEQNGGRDIIKLIDFGRALLIQDEDGYPPKGRGLEGSIFFCSPEQILKEDLDVRSDLYSLGTVFYYVLTRQRPFDGRNPISIMSAHLQHKVKDISEIIPNIPKWLAEWVMALMALEKEDRPQSAAEALDILLHGRDEQKVTKFRA